MKFLIFALLMTLGIGCADQSKQKYKNKAGIEADAEIEAQQKLSIKMETDLARLQLFYQGVRGLYKGTVKTPSGRKFKVQFNIHPTIERYEGSRIRSVEEINADLQRLAFDIGEQTSSVLSDGSDIALVCNYNDVKPGVDRGLFYLHAEGCPRFFQVNVVPEGSGKISDAQVLDQISRRISSQLLDGSLEHVVQLQVVMTTQNISTPMTFTMTKVFSN